MQFHRLFEYPQMIPFSLYFCSKRCRVTRVSFLLLPSQFILEDWHIKQPGGRCIGSWARAIEFKKKLIAMVKLFPLCQKFMVLFTFTAVN